MVDLRLGSGKIEVKRTDKLGECFLLSFTSIGKLNFSLASSIMLSREPFLTLFFLIVSLSTFSNSTTA